MLLSTPVMLFGARLCSAHAKDLQELLFEHTAEPDSLVVPKSGLVGSWRAWRGFDEPVKLDVGGASMRLETFVTLGAEDRTPILWIQLRDSSASHRWKRDQLFEIRNEAESIATAKIATFINTQETKSLGISPDFAFEFGWLSSDHEEIPFLIDRLRRLGRFVSDDGFAMEGSGIEPFEAVLEAGGWSPYSRRYHFWLSRDADQNLAPQGGVIGRGTLRTWGLSYSRDEWSGQDLAAQSTIQSADSLLRYVSSGARADYSCASHSGFTTDRYASPTPSSLRGLLRHVDKRTLGNVRGWIADHALTRSITEGAEVRTRAQRRSIA